MQHFKVKATLWPIRRPPRHPIKLIKPCINSALGSFLQGNLYIKGVKGDSLGVFCASNKSVMPKSCTLIPLSCTRIAWALGLYIQLKVASLCPIRKPSSHLIKFLKACTNNTSGSFLLENPYIKGVQGDSLGVFDASNKTVMPKSYLLP